MTYIYDIILNFNKRLIEFFEWEDKDDIKYIKKVILFKTDNKTIKDFIENEILLDSSFTNNIPKYEINNIKERKICLITNGEIVIGILINNNKIECISKLLLDEEYEALLVSNNMDEITIKYKVLKQKHKIPNTLTRNELKVKNLLQEEIEQLYKSKNKEKLIYLYYEYTNQENKDIDYIYKYLKDSLNSFNDKHFHIYKILSITM